MAKKAKKDEFYTQLSDIERELKYYKNHFRNKVPDPNEIGIKPLKGEGDCLPIEL